MATIAEPALRRRSSKASEPVAPARHRKRDEIIGLIAFCVVLLLVYLTRNYAS
jgi:hypothetical protein